MIKFFSKIIFLFALVLTSINICYPGDTSCSKKDSTSYANQSSSKTSASSDSEDSHCACSMSCHRLFINFSSMSAKSLIVILNDSPLIHISSNYPQVLLSFDKPPTV